MSMIRAGYTLPLDEPTYDAMADLKAHNSSVKVTRLARRSERAIADALLTRRHVNTDLA